MKFSTKELKTLFLKPVNGLKKIKEELSWAGIFKEVKNGC